jgi:hypothetical protein
LALEGSAGLDTFHFSVVHSLSFDYRLTKYQPLPSLPLQLLFTCFLNKAISFHQGQQKSCVRSTLLGHFWSETEPFTPSQPERQRSSFSDDRQRSQKINAMTEAVYKTT